MLEAVARSQKLASARSREASEPKSSDFSAPPPATGGLPVAPDTVRPPLGSLRQFKSSFRIPVMTVSDEAVDDVLEQFVPYRRARRHDAIHRSAGVEACRAPHIPARRPIEPQDDERAAVDLSWNASSVS